MKKLKSDGKKLKLILPEIHHTLQLIGTAEAWEAKVSKSFHFAANKTKMNTKTTKAKAPSLSKNLPTAKINKLVEEYYQFDFVGRFPDAIQVIE